MDSSRYLAQIVQETIGAVLLRSANVVLLQQAVEKHHYYYYCY